jgi:hypothetical protein
MRLIIFCILGFYIYSFAQSPQIYVQSVNLETVGLYEKFEIIVAMENVSYTNPYNPNDVDLCAVFYAPSGKVWEIFGFYDNYNTVNHWKVRFAPNETGTWSYNLTLQSSSGQAQSSGYSFNVSESDYHGWIRISPSNPHYFIYDDGTPFYGVGPYYPWGVTNTSSGLGQLEASGCNFWGYWNIMYDTGEIIESINSGLGRYDQPKCGRIDQLINWSEERNLKMMLAIWPHDLLSNTVWAHQWHNNPYKYVCDVEEFYKSEVAWSYQEMQYRYIIARWGYSRALAVWEIVNEVNGTDGWVAGKQNEARIWVGRVHDYLTSNDPHQRPTTASMSGGEYWPEGYAEVDISNVHMYETGWTAKYPGNSLRSSAYTYYKVAKQQWNDFEKPAIFGEAGYTNSYGNYPAGSAEYTAMFHNALWASLCGGLAAIPLWWDFGSKQLMTADVMNQMHIFSQIARDYNYGYQNFNPYEIIAAGCDVYAMRSNTSIFGWVREEYGSAVKGHILQFKALEDTSYQITWYNTWTAEMIGQNFIVGIDTLVSINVPETAGEIPDAAFFIEKTAEGVTPAQLIMGTTTNKIYVKRNEEVQILCTVHDIEGRFVRSATNTIQFRVEGPGRLLGPDIVDAVTGMARIIFTNDSTSGLAKIIAESQDLKSDTLKIEVANRIWVDNFEGYESITNLQYVWHVRAGTTADLSMAGSITGELGTSLRINYTIGDGNAPYAGVYRYISEELSSSEQLEFWFKGDASGRTLAVLIYEKYGRYWQYDYIIGNNEPEFLRVPLLDFTAGDTASIIKLDEVDEISFNILKGEGEVGQGTVYLDEINFVIPALETAVDQRNFSLPPDKFLVMQNYPNPFNSITTIRYVLPQPGKVSIEVYDTTGRVVERLLSGIQQTAGEHRILWQNTCLASGVYFYRIRTGTYEAVRKCLLIK